MVIYTAIKTRAKYQGVEATLASGTIVPVLVGNTVLQTLEFIVHYRPIVLVSVLDDSYHVLGSLLLVELQLESVPQPLDGRFSLERGQSGPKHQVHSIDQLIGIRSDGQERLDGELAEHSESLTVPAAHESHHLVIKLETVGFKLDTSRTNVEEESEIDVDNVSFAINHDVSIVTILDLKNITSNRVGGHGLDKVEPGFLERRRVETAVLVDEVAV